MSRAATGIKIPYKSEREALGKLATEFQPNNIPAQPIPGVISCLDLFAGGGGFQLALMRAARAAGFTVESRLVNHWSVALDNARENLGPVHIFNAGVQDLNPREVVSSGYVDILTAAPECVFFSSARGAKPINDQRRSTFAEVLRYVEELHVRTILLENVVEAMDWCRLDPETLRPIKKYKGEYFKAFIKALQRMGYDVAYQTVVAADQGDPTTRRRLYLCAQRQGRASFPLPTHSKDGKVPGTLPWVPARTIIDFSIKGASIFERPSPLAIKTVNRVEIGFADQTNRSPLAYAYVEALQRFKRVAEIYHEQIDALPSPAKLGRKLSKEEREQRAIVKSAAAAQHRVLTEQAFSTPVSVLDWNDILLHNAVEPTIEGNNLTLGTLGALEPVIAKLYGTGTTSSPNQPLDTVTAGGVNFGVAKAEPDSFMVTVNHADTGSTQRRTLSLDDPMVTVCAKNGHVVISPETNAVSEPAGLEPFIASYYGPKGNNVRRPRTLNNPLATQPTENRFALVQPEMAREIAIPDAVIISRNNARGDRDRRPHRLTEPAPTATGSGAGYLAEPEIAIQNNVEPVIVPQHRGVDVDRLDRPIRALTACNGNALAVPIDKIGITPGKPFVIVGNIALQLDVLYRLLVPDELARAMSFSTDQEQYKWSKRASVSARVKLVGNAVAVRTASALITHALQHRFTETAIAA